MAGAPQGGMNTTATNQNTSPATSTSTSPIVPTNNVFNQSAQGLNLAMAGTAQGMGYAPMGVQAATYNPTQIGGVAAYDPAFASHAGYDANTWQAGQLANTSLNPYMNPFEQTVIGGLQTDALRGQQMASNELGAQATAAGAFGGSRHGVAEGVQNANIQRNLNNQIGQLRLGGYQNSQNMALTDIANRMAASQANQNALNQAGQFGASAFNQAALANQQAANAAGQFGANAANQVAQLNQGALNQAGQYNANNIMQAQQLNQQAGLAGNQQRLAAANQMGNLSNLGFGMGMETQQNMMQQGALQQALQQAVFDAAKNQYAGYQDSPYRALTATTTALGGTPYGSTTTTSGGQYKPGLFDYLMGGMTAYGMYNR